MYNKKKNKFFKGLFCVFLFFKLNKTKNECSGSLVDSVLDYYREVRGLDSQQRLWAVTLHGRSHSALILGPPSNVFFQLVFIS